MHKLPYRCGKGGEAAELLAWCATGLVPPSWSCPTWMGMGMNLSATTQAMVPHSKTSAACTVTATNLN